MEQHGFLDHLSSSSVLVFKISEGAVERALGWDEEATGFRAEGLRT